MAEGVVISVVIPSRDNRERLIRTLESIARLDFDLDALEVVVEDDGSTDGTCEALGGRRWPFRLDFERGEHGNQSAATNAAAARASGHFLLCSASDLIFDPRIVTKHLELHERFAGEDVGVLGYLPYTDELNARPLMFYLMNGGPQFGYSSIRDPYRLAPSFCYAPNFSLTREVYQRVGGFDPFFRYGGQDTDLGYRLAMAGVRLAYAHDAIAWHDHPVTLEDYFKRQKAAGISSVLLEMRHPDLEGGAPIWNAAIGRYLGYPIAMTERDLQLVATLEPLIARAHPHYQRLWSDVMCRRSRRPSSLDAEEQRLFDATQNLFAAYDRLVRFHWGKAFFEEAIRRHGPEHVGQRVLHRVLRSQTTIQLRRTAERRLAAHGIRLPLCRSADALDSLVIHGLRDYASAIEALSQFYSPREGIYSREILLVLDKGRFSAAELDRLAELAEPIIATSVASGIAEALGRSHGDFVTLRGPDVDERNPDARWIAQKLFERIERLAVLGSAVPDADPGRLLVGHRFDGTPVSVPAERAGGAGELQPVDVALADYLLLRGETARTLAAGADPLADSEGRGWTWALGRRVAASGGLTLHVPALEAATRQPEVAHDGASAWNAFS